MIIIIITATRSAQKPAWGLLMHNNGRILVGEFVLWVQVPHNNTTGQYGSIYNQRYLYNKKNMTFPFKVPLLTCPYNIGTDASIFQYPLTIVKFFFKVFCFVVFGLISNASEKISRQEKRSRGKIC